MAIDGSIFKPIVDWAKADETDPFRNHFVHVDLTILADDNQGGKTQYAYSGLLHLDTAVNIFLRAGFTILMGNLTAGPSVYPGNIAASIIFRDHDVSLVIGSAAQSEEYTGDAIYSEVPHSQDQVLFLRFPRPDGPNTLSFTLPHKIKIVPERLNLLVPIRRPTGVRRPDRPPTASSRPEATPIEESNALRQIIDANSATRRDVH